MIFVLSFALLLVGLSAGLFYFADAASFPRVVGIPGSLQLAVGFGLILVPPALQRRFAHWAALSLRPLFRPAGVVSLGSGLFPGASVMT